MVTEANAVNQAATKARKVREIVVGVDESDASRLALIWAGSWSWRARRARRWWSSRAPRSCLSWDIAGAVNSRASCWARSGCTACCARARRCWSSARPRRHRTPRPPSLGTADFLMLGAIVWGVGGTVFLVLPDGPRAKPGDRSGSLHPVRVRYRDSGWAGQCSVLRDPGPHRRRRPPPPRSASRPALIGTYESGEPVTAGPVSIDREGVTLPTGVRRA
jgi:hypothetical protein